MRIIVLGKREMSGLILGCLALCLALYTLISWNGGAVSAAAEPYYQGVGEENRVSLAINVDWGEEFIPDMLKVMEAQEIKATFFLTGRWTENHPELAKTIAEAGHEIGNHAYSHASPNKMGFEGNCEEISRTAEAIKNATGLETRLYAPPSGERDAAVLEAAEAEEHITILWSVDTVDWKRPAASVIFERVTKKIHPGAIILAHPTHPTLQALPEIITNLKEQGYTFVTVSENLNL